MVLVVGGDLSGLWFWQWHAEISNELLRVPQYPREGICAREKSNREPVPAAQQASTLSPTFPCRIRFILSGRAARILASYSDSCVIYYTYYGVLRVRAFGEAPSRGAGKGNGGARAIEQALCFLFLLIVSVAPVEIISLDDWEGGDQVRPATCLRVTAEMATFLVPVTS